MDFKSYIKKAASDIKTAADSLVDKMECAHNKYKLEGELEELYKTLGQIRYEELCGKCDASEENEKIAEEITIIKSKLAEYEKTRICVNCGEKVTFEAAFCPHCGQRF